MDGREVLPKNMEWGNHNLSFRFVQEVGVVVVVMNIEKESRTSWGYLRRL